MLDFGNFQLGIIASAISNTEFLKLIAHRIQPEDFKNRIARNLYKWVQDYYIQYKKAPKNHIEEIIEENSEKFSREELEDYTYFLERAYNTHPNPEFLLDNIGEYLKRLAIERAIDEATVLKEENKLDDAIEVLHKGFSAGIDTNDYGIDYLTDKSRYWRRAVREEIAFRTMIPEVDRALGGGLKKKWFAMVAATMKRGKSWFLCNLARSGLTQGLNTLYITLEMSKEEVEDRLDMMHNSLLEKPNEYKNYVKVPFYTCSEWHARKYCPKLKKDKQRLECHRCERKKDGYVSEESIKFDTIENSKRVKKGLGFIDQFGGKLFIKEYSSRKMNITTLEGLLDDLIAFKDFYAELVIIDYADLMSGRSFYAEKRDKLDEIYKDLKDIAKERNCIIFTASQAIRGAIDKARLSQKDIAEDIRKFAHIDLGFMLGSTADQRLEGRVNCLCAAFRHGKQDWVVELLQCYDIGQFCIDGRWVDLKLEDKIIFADEEDEN